MRALVFDGTLLTLKERPRPVAEEGYAVIRVEIAGICNTDLEIKDGYMGFRGILGHEFVGTVASGPASWTGRRVVSEINFGCGECEECLLNESRHCATRRVMGILDADGAFAEYVAAPVRNLHAVPDEVKSQEAVFCEPLAAAFEILEQITVQNGQGCTVIGDGKLGLLIAQVLADAGARVCCVGRHAANLAILTNLGIETTTLDAWSGNHANSSDLVVEATGRAEGFRLAVEATRPRGTLVLKSTLAASGEIDLAPLVIDEIRLVGSRCGPFTPALRALKEHRIAVEPLVSGLFPLARADEGLSHAGTRGVRKVLVDCAGTHDTR